MKNVLELFYNQPKEWCGFPSGQDSLFTKTARKNAENLEMLNDSMTDEQKQLFDAYFDSNTKLEGIMDLDSFRYAFHLGAQIMAELIEGKEDLLK